MTAWHLIAKALSIHKHRSQNAWKMRHVSLVPFYGKNLADCQVLVCSTHSEPANIPRAAGGLGLEDGKRGLEK